MFRNRIEIQIEVNIGIRYASVHQDVGNPLMILFVSVVLRVSMADGHRLPSNYYMIITFVYYIVLEYITLWKSKTKPLIQSNSPPAGSFHNIDLTPHYICSVVLNKTSILLYHSKRLDMQFIAN